ncbi:MAG: permease-like cell division protein FtsX [Alloprevotella sp.]|nr:permease-like cell division protein FtsX [Alloprevotella sp.]
MSNKKPQIAGTFGRFTTCLSTALVLVMLGIVVCFVTIAHNFGNTLRANVPLELMLDDSITTPQRQQIENFVHAASYVDSVRYISKEVGTQEMATAMSESPTEFVGYSPVPAEYEVYLRSEYATMDSLKMIEPQLRKLAGVTEVDYPKDTLKSLDTAIPLVTIVLLSVAVLLSFISFALINNSVRMGIYARRFSIHTMKLVGAKWSFIRRPFMGSAFWMGFFAALIAGSLVGGGIYLLTTTELFLATLVTWQVWALTLGSIFVFGLLLSLACTYFSVNRFLKMREKDIFLK